MNDSLPPLLRGIGALVILLATVIAFYIARQHDQLPHPDMPPNRTGDTVAALVSEVDKLRAEVEQDTVSEKVLENFWFECLGFAGTAIFATSFFAEAYLRREKKA